MNEELKTKRAWSNLSDEAFKKIQDLQAVVANNKETMEALRHAIDVHTSGLELLTTDAVEPIRDQFNSIITNFSTSYDNLGKYNYTAEEFLNRLESTNSNETLLLIEALLKLVAFK